MSKQFPKLKEFYETIINDIYSLSIKIRLKDTNKSIEEYFENNKNVSDFNKKIDISKNYSSGKDLQIKKCNNIIPLTTNLMKYI